MKTCAHSHCTKKFTPSRGGVIYCNEWCRNDEYRMRRDDTKHAVAYPADRESWLERRRKRLKRKIKARVKEVEIKKAPVCKPRFTAGMIQHSTPEQVIRQMNKWTQGEENYSVTLMKARV